jgi:hypothetical protein
VYLEKLENLKFLDLRMFVTDYQNIPKGLIRDDLRIEICQLFTHSVKDCFNKDVLSQAALKLDLESVQKLAKSHSEKARERDPFFNIRLIEYICSKNLSNPITFQICDILNDVVPHSILGLDYDSLTPVHYLFRSIAQRIRTGKPVDDLLIIAKKWTYNYIEDENPPEK